MSDVQELVIVGSGPAGYTAAIYAARVSSQMSPMTVSPLALRNVPVRIVSAVRCAALH